MPFEYSVLDGKHMTGEGVRGDIHHLSTTGAVIRVTEPVEMLSNLKMMLPALEGGDEIVGDLYAKVVDDEPGDGRFKVRFTAVPEDVAAAIEHVVGGVVQDRCDMPGRPGRHDFRRPAVH